jgi:hypothetical protein
MGIGVESSAAFLQIMQNQMTVKEAKLFVELDNGKKDSNGKADQAI